MCPGESCTCSNHAFEGHTPGNLGGNHEKITALSQNIKMKRNNLMGHVVRALSKLMQKLAILERGQQSLNTGGAVVDVQDDIKSHLKKDII